MRDELNDQGYRDALARYVTELERIESEIRAHVNKRFRKLGNASPIEFLRLHSRRAVPSDQALQRQLDCRNSMAYLWKQYARALFYYAVQLGAEPDRAILWANRAQDAFDEVLAARIAARAQALGSSRLARRRGGYTSDLLSLVIILLAVLLAALAWFAWHREPFSRHADCGQLAAKRALEIAAAGGHNVLLVGPPGCGKTMLARRLPSILPPMSMHEALEVTKIYSVAGLLVGRAGIVRARPFRFPHHTISQTALVGGGALVKPGEISLAHHGVLFLDELPEFARSAIEVMRQPIEEGTVTIARATGTFTYPARFQLVASMNPCPCGYRGTRSAECRCDDAMVAKYVGKLSGPLLDRIDLQIEIARVPFDDMVRYDGAEHSSQIRGRVVAARERQRARYAQTRLACNAEIPANAMRRYCALDEPAMRLLAQASAKRQFSARALDRIARVARTIADLAGAPAIRTEHVAEAIQYRSLERLGAAA